VWNRPRSESKLTLGGKFDMRDFHRAGLSAGTMPRELLVRVIGDFNKQKGTPS